jgi:hypothetical protein
MLPLLVLAGCAPAPEIDQQTQALTTRTSFEDPGRFIAVEGRECLSGTENIEAWQTWRPPDWVDRGTVLLNGWHARYTDGDHHVKYIGLRMKEAAFAPTLHLMAWKIVGTLADGRYDDGIELCWAYTAIGWSSAAIDARVEHQDGLEIINQRDDVSSLTSAWALGSLFGDDANLGVAVIPRGFRLGFHDTHSSWNPEGVFKVPDHHIQEIAYHLGQDTVASTQVGFTAKGIIRDYQSHRYLQFITGGALVGGSGVGVVAPSFSIESVDRCNEVGAVQGEKWDHVEQDVPQFDYVVPMLTGFELSFQCHDEHLKRAGMAVQGMSWDPATRRLEFDVMSALADQDNTPAFSSRRQVTLLGFRRRPPVGPSADNPGDVLARP